MFFYGFVHLLSGLVRFLLSNIFKWHFHTSQYLYYFAECTLYKPTVLPQESFCTFFIRKNEYALGYVLCGQNGMFEQPHTSYTAMHCINIQADEDFHITMHARKARTKQDKNVPCIQ